MKKILFASLLGIFSAFAVNAQDNKAHDNKAGHEKINDKDVPQAVRTAFDNQYDNAMMVDWKMKDGNYKAMFTKDMKKHFAEYSSSGELVCKGEKIKKDDLPTAVADAVKKGYANSEVDDVYRVEKGGQTEYMLKLDGKNKVVYNSEGKVVKEK